jgi:predicted transposase/invertase (TIGR01784 family)
MSETILNPKPLNDEAFKTVFGDPKHSDNLKRFLSSFGEFPGGEIRSLSISDPFLRRWRWHDKYGELKPVVSILICDFEMFPDSKDEYYNRIRLWNEQVKKVFTNLVKIIIIELPKVPVEKDRNEVWRWLKFLKAETKEELEMLVKDEPELKEAADTIVRMGWSERHRRLAEARERYRRDMWAYGDKELKEGLEKGIKIGEQNSAAALAAKDAEIAELKQQLAQQAH